MAWRAFRFLGYTILIAFNQSSWLKNDMIVPKTAMSEQSPIASPHPDLDQQLLVMMVGIPGSGKTSFARPLADRLNAYRFNMDLLRGEIYGTANRQEYIDWHQREEKRLKLEAPDRETIDQFWRQQLERQWQAIDDRLTTNLAAGRSIVIDSSEDQRSNRDTNRELADRYQVPAVVAWMQIPHEAAVGRATSRQLTADSYPFPTPDKAEAEIQRCRNQLDQPGPDEACVQIDGQQDFASQYDTFVDFCRRHFNQSDPNNQ